VLPDGGPLRFTQDPTLLTADYTGAITLRDFLILGDVPTVQFALPVTNSVETWSRTGTLNLGGRTVSVFNPSWPASQLTEVMRSYEVGFDYPELYWGEVLPPGVESGKGYPVTLRFASNTIPSVTVRQLAPDVQYSSGVANIRLDGFGDNRAVDNSTNFDFASVTKKFYQYFEDSYDTIAVVTQDATPSRVAAFHGVVRSDVKGIGADLYDDSAFYGSAARLRGVEFFYGTSVTNNETIAHEAAHQWGDFIDWSKLTGLSRAGHQANVHDPLMTGGATMIGAVLRPTRRVANNGGWVIEQTAPPIGFHPVTLYAMGLIPREAVADITLFDDQGQFADGVAATPAPGTPVSGATRSTTMASVVGMLGARQGPVLSELQRAIVIVSSGRLLTQREMSYWTFYAQRTADPNHSSVATIDGFVSFDAATANAIDLKHEIRPTAGGAIVEPLPVDYPNVAPSDLRGATLDAPLPTFLGIGTQLRISGRVTATDRNDFSSITFILRPAVGNPGGIIRGDAAVTSSGGFVINMPALQAENAGRYILQVYLLFPNAGSQNPRVNAGPITVG